LEADGACEAEVLEEAPATAAADEDDEDGRAEVIEEEEEALEGVPRLALLPLPNGFSSWSVMGRNSKDGAAKFG